MTDKGVADGYEMLLGLRDARITALEAANAAQSVRIATLLEDNHCIPELEARIKELEAALTPFAAGYPNTDHRDYIRARSALGDQHECD